MELRVDPVACDGYGYCAELLPELIGPDEWGFPVIVAGMVPPVLVDMARRAVADCPRRALQLVHTDDRRPAPEPSRVVLASTRR